MNDFQKSITRFLYVALVVFTAVGIFAVFQKSAAHRSRADTDFRAGNGVTATGSCVVRTKPDVAEVSIGIDQSSHTASAARADIKRRAEKVIQTLRGFGIEEKDIQTEHYSLQPNWKEKYNVMDWNAEEYLRVKVRKLDSVAEILDAAMKSGANHVGGLTYSVEDINSLRAKGRAKAAKVARDKAEQLASSLGGKLGRLVACNEYYPGEGGQYWAGWNYQPYYRNYNGAINAQANVNYLDGHAAPDTTDREEITIQPGELVLNVTVSATYEVL